MPKLCHTAFGAVLQWEELCVHRAKAWYQEQFCFACVMEGNTSGQAICNVSSWNESQSLLIETVVFISNSAGILSSLAAIVLVLITRAYKEFIQRLFLYLAITATFVCTLLLFDSVVNYVHVNSGTITKKEIQFQMAMRIPVVYFDMVYGLLLCWIGVYVASLTIGIRRFKSIRHEMVGLAIVTITPLTASVVWIIPVVQNPYHCDIMLSIILITLLLSVLMVTLSVGAVIFHLCRSGLKCNSSVHVRALKEATPLLTFVVIHQIAVGFLLTYAIVQYSDETELPPNSLVVLYSSVPAVLFVSIPLFLLCQPRIRHGIRCKKKRQQQQSVGVWNPSTGIQDVTSQTHYIVPPESSFTEEDPLIIKQ